MIEVWLSTIAEFLGASRYAAHSICLTSDTIMVNLFVLADGSIALAYFALASVLYIAYRSRARVIRVALALLGDPVFLKLFAGFILACGITHLTMVLTLFYGVYYLDIFARCITAGVSIVSAMRVVAVSVNPTKGTLEEEIFPSGVAPDRYKPLVLPPGDPHPKLKR